LTQLTGSPLAYLHTHSLRSNTTLALTATTYSSSKMMTLTAAESHVIRIATTGNVFFKGDNDDGTGTPPSTGAEYLLTEGVHYLRYDSSTGQPYLYFRLHAAGTATVNITQMNPIN